MKKITVTSNGVILNAPATASAKMAHGFLARTTLTAWLFGSLGCINILFATALCIALANGSRRVVYGSIDFDITSVSKNAYGSYMSVTATAMNCYGSIETANIKVTLDYNKGLTARKCMVYKPCIKTERACDIHCIDGFNIDFDAVGFDRV